MSQTNLIHALAMGALLVSVLWLMRRSGLLQGRSKGGRMEIVFPFVFVVVPVVNPFWTVPG